jgi:hypothetical protein
LLNSSSILRISAVATLPFITGICMSANKKKFIYIFRYIFF